MSVRTYLQTQLAELLERRIDRTVFLARVTECLAQDLGCSRVSVWHLSPDRERLECDDLFLAEERQHRPGGVLHRRRVPDYFGCLESSRTLVAAEAQSHPGTCSLNEDYLVPQDIRSLLDSPLLRRGKFAGLLRCEQTGTPRAWPPRDLLTVRMATMLVGSAGL